MEAIEPAVMNLLAALRRSGWFAGHLPNGSSASEPSEQSAIELALREALANAVLHGNGSDPAKRVTLDCLEQHDGSLLLLVRDQGRGFDPTRISDPTHPENVIRAGGRGIFLIHHFMDEVEFNDGGREIRMRKKR